MPVKKVDETVTLTEEEAINVRRDSKRKKTYVRRDASEVPEYVQDHFRKKGYEVRFVRHKLAGGDDYRNLAKREQEGYEFVTSSEVPKEYMDTLRIDELRDRKDIVTQGDLCLMKVDVDLREDRRRYYENITAGQLSAVDANNLRKKGLDINQTRSKTVMREPSFRD